MYDYEKILHKSVEVYDDKFAMEWQKNVDGNKGKCTAPADEACKDNDKNVVKNNKPSNLRRM